MEYHTYGEEIYYATPLYNNDPTPIPSPNDAKTEKTSKCNRICCVPECHTTGYKLIEGHGKPSYHSFPREGDPLRVTWLSKIKRDFQITRNSVVCSLHFEEDMTEIFGYSKRRYLKPGAIPTIFDCWKNKSDNYKPNKWRPINSNVRNNKVILKSSEVRPKNSKVRPKNIEVRPRSENSKARPKIGKVRPKKSQVGPKNSQVGRRPKNSKVGPKNSEVRPKNSDVRPRLKNSKVRPRNSEVRPKNSKVRPRPKNSKVRPQNSEVIPKNSKVGSRNSEMGPKNRRQKRRNQISGAYCGAAQTVEFDFCGDYYTLHDQPVGEPAYSLDEGPVLKKSRSQFQSAEVETSGDPRNTGCQCIAMRFIQDRAFEHNVGYKIFMLAKDTQHESSKDSTSSIGESQKCVTAKSQSCVTAKSQSCVTARSLNYQYIHVIPKSPNCVTTKSQTYVYVTPKSQSCVTAKSPNYVYATAKSQNCVTSKSPNYVYATAKSQNCVTSKSPNYVYATAKSPNL